MLRSHIAFAVLAAEVVIAVPETGNATPPPIVIPPKQVNTIAILGVAANADSVTGGAPITTSQPLQQYAEVVITNPSKSMLTWAVPALSSRSAADIVVTSASIDTITKALVPGSGVRKKYAQWTVNAISVTSSGATTITLAQGSGGVVSALPPPTTPSDLSLAAQADPTPTPTCTIDGAGFGTPTSPHAVTSFRVTPFGAIVVMPTSQDDTLSMRLWTNNASITARMACSPVPATAGAVAVGSLVVYKLSGPRLSTSTAPSAGAQGSVTFAAKAE